MSKISKWVVDVALHQKSVLLKSQNTIINYAKIDTIWSTWLMSQDPYRGRIKERFCG